MTDLTPERIRELRDEEQAVELANLREAARWIPVGERLPEQGQRVLVEHEGAVSISRIFLAPGSGPEQWRDAGVSHWCPLPDPPEREGA